MLNIAFPLLLAGYFVMINLMLILWVYQAFSKNASVVDLGWAAGLVLLACLYFISGDGYVMRKLLMLAMAVIWGIRLLCLLIERLIHNPLEDKRYQKKRMQWGKLAQVKFFLMFQFHALLAAVLSLPFLMACLNAEPRLAWIEYLGLVMWALALIGELTADKQLRQFKRNPLNKGKTCQAGLWRYSRHPNYFFEWLIWVSFSLVALASPLGWIGLVSPALMLYFILKVSGIPLAEEQSLLSRGDEYRTYQKTTSIFVPLPKKTE